MKNKIHLNQALIERYDHAGPRYTSYPTAKQFHNNVNDDDYITWVEASNEDPIPATLSLYLHIPFCDTICYYCGCSKIVTQNKTKAAPYLDLLKQEIALQSKLLTDDRRVCQIHWGGGTPTFLSDEQIGDLMQTLYQHFNINDDCECGIEVDPRTVDQQRIQYLRQQGFNRISFGVQDFDKNVQQAVNRVHSTQEIMHLIEAARQSKFDSINIDLMYGLPEQNINTFKQTLKHTIQANPDRIAVYNYAHMPEMFKPQRRIHQQYLPAAEQKLAILNLTIEKLQEAGYVYIGMDHFARESDALVQAQINGSLHRNFQGYSTHANCDIIAMGITAISRVGDNYGQNVRTIEEYTKRLEQNRFAVFRGIELEPDDVLRREVINQLMCNYTLDIRRLEHKWQIDFLNYFNDALPALHRMVKDGLVVYWQSRLDITTEGRLLTRSICMLFDRYIQHDKTQTDYSKVI